MSRRGRGSWYENLRNEVQDDYEGVTKNRWEESVKFKGSEIGMGAGPIEDNEEFGDFGSLNINYALLTSGGHKYPLSVLLRRHSRTR